MPYFFFFVCFILQCLICIFFFIFYFLLQSLFIQPYSNVGLQSFSCSYLFSLLLLCRLSVRSCNLLLLSRTGRQTKARCVDACADSFTQTVHTHTHILKSNTHAMTMRKTHFLLRSQSHICSTVNTQSLTCSATKVMQSVCGVRCCYSVIFIISKKEWKTSNLIFIYIYLYLYLYI